MYKPKFRAWITKELKMVEVYSIQYGGIGDNWGIKTITELKRKGNICIPGREFKYEEIILMSSIGMRDKANTLLYAGDVVLAKCKIAPKGNKVVRPLLIVWREIGIPGFSFAAVYQGGFVYPTYMDITSMEKIGNQFEDAEDLPPTT